MAEIIIKYCPNEVRSKEQSQHGDILDVVEDGVAAEWFTVIKVPNVSVADLKNLKDKGTSHKNKYYIEEKEMDDMFSTGHSITLRLGDFNKINIADKG